MSELSKKVLKYLITILLIIGSCYLAVKDVNFSELGRIIANANYLWIILSVPIIIMSHWIRAMRWRTMLEPALKTKSPSTWNLFSAVMIGYGVNAVLPRGGEFLRPYIYSRREKVSFSTSFATIIAERFIDVVTLVVLFGVVFLFFSHKITQGLPAIEPNKVLVPTILVLAVLFMSFYAPFVNAVLKIFIKPFSAKFYYKLSQIFEKFLKGFVIIKTPSRYFRLTAESLLIWFFYTVPMYLMFFSFDYQSIYHLNFTDAIILIIVSGVGATIAPTPGAIGIYHFLIQNAMMRLYGMKAEEALAYATLTHAINYLIQLLIGGFFFMRENVKKLPQKSDISSELEIAED